MTHALVMTTSIVTEYGTLYFFGPPCTRVLVVGRDRAGVIVSEQVSKGRR